MSNVQYVIINFYFLLMISSYLIIYFLYTFHCSLASPMRKIESEADKVAPLRTDKKIDLEEKAR